jgi:catechol 2,3-dioxygenase-like lactoylglutathione lyase family enzyme
MFKGVAHTGLIVSDIDTLVPFLCDVFEMEVKADLGLQTGPEAGQIMGLPGAHVKIVMLEKGGHTLELLEIVKPEREPIAKETPYGEVGHCHLAFEVDDIDAAYARVREAGAEIVVPPQVIPELKFFYLRAPNNQWFEVVEVRG